MGAFARRQRGFMIEVPLMAVVILGGMAWLIPTLAPAIGALVGLAGGGAFVAGAYYLFIAPGWQPGERMAKFWSWTWFCLIALAMLALVVALVVRALGGG